MKVAGFLLLCAGFAIVLCTFLLLSAAAPRAAFVLAGIAVQATRAHARLPRALHSGRGTIMQTQPVALTEAGMALCMVCIFLVPLAAAGLALVNTGFGRGRSAAHSMLSAMCVFAVAVLACLLVGFSLQGFAGGPARLLSFGGRSWNLLGSASLLMRGSIFNNPTLSLVACLQLFSVGIAAMIPLGAGSDRWRLRASCASTALLAGITYPVFAHWVWGGGWLAQLGSLASCGNGAIDAGGAGVIQAVGGLTALSITWILGPRQGKYEDDGNGHSRPQHALRPLRLPADPDRLDGPGLGGCHALCRRARRQRPADCGQQPRRRQCRAADCRGRHPAALRQTRRLHRRQRIRHRPGCHLWRLFPGFTGHRRSHRTGRRPRRFPFRSSGWTASAATIPAAPSPCMLSEACGASSPPVFSSIPVPASGWPRQR